MSTSPAAVDTWDRQRVRLVVAGSASDLDPSLRLCAALMPWWAIRDLADEPSGLFHTVWAPAASRGVLEVHGVGDVPWFDCGTPRSYLAANLWTSGGATIVGAGARLSGSAERSVLWPDTEVRARRTARFGDPGLRSSHRARAVTRLAQWCGSDPVAGQTWKTARPCPTS